MSPELKVKFKQTAKRILHNDATVYKDLRNYTKAKIFKERTLLESAVKQKSSKISSAIIVSSRDRLASSVLRLINLEFYSEQTGRSFESEEEALKHYRKYWAVDLLDPHPLFNTRRYLQNAISEVTVSPIDDFFARSDSHMVRVSSLFDPEFYRQKYPWTASQNPLLHFLTSGFVERHQPIPIFDTDFYLQSNSMHMSGMKNAYMHFLLRGWRDGYNPHPLVDMSYLANQLDAKTDLDEFESNPFLDFIVGAAINPSPWFDATYFRLGLDLNHDHPQQIHSSPCEAFSYYLNGDCGFADASPRFSESFYTNKHPDTVDFKGLYHFIRYGQSELRSYSSSMPDIGGALYQDALNIDPYVCAPHQDIKVAEVVLTPRSSDPVIQAIQDLVSKRGGFVPDIVYVFRGFVKGGAVKYGAKLVNALAEMQPDLKILVMAYDTIETTTSDWISERDNIHVIYAGEPLLELSVEQRAVALGRFLMWTDPHIIINNNSHAAWVAYELFGKALSNRTRLFATLYCYDFDEYGHKVGYARSFVRETIEHVDTIITDSSNFGDMLVDDLSLNLDDSRKFKTLFQHTDSEVFKTSQRSGRSSNRVLWAARISQQKNVSMLRRLALEMPDTTFCMWAVGEWDDNIANGPKPKNIEIIDDATSFSEAANREIDAFLLTSFWEGLPTTIIEATIEGLPVIAANVGGVTDLIDEESGWLVDPEDLEGFVYSLNTCLRNPEETSSKVKKAQAKLSSQHSMKRYQRTLKNLGLLQAKGTRKLKSKSPRARGIKSDEKQEVTIVSDVRLAKTTLDVTICINGHREREVIVPTLKSCCQSLRHLQENGLSGEILLILDNPDEVTRSICYKFVKSNAIRIIEINVRDLGLARNLGVRIAKGKYVAFMDGDDMMSKNWATQGFRAGEAFGDKVFLHPTTNYIFGNGNTYLYVHRDMEDPEFNLSSLVAENYWTAISMGPRQLYLEFPYEVNNLKTGLAYEDWSWHCKTVAKGIKHKVVPNSSHFIRRKKSGSLLAETSASGALPRLFYLRETPALLEEVS